MNPMLKRLMNLLPLAGLLIAAWGAYGLLRPIGQAAVNAAQDDPSLEAKGFALPTAAETLTFQRGWVKVDATQTTSTPTTAAATLAPTPLAGDPRGQVKFSEPEELPAVPDRIVIPSIALDAPVVLAPTRKLTLQQQVFEQWLAPDDFAVGYHIGSAYLGKPGNTVLNGHHNIFGKVFARLIDLQSGDIIQVYSGERIYTYVVAQSMILKERGASLAEREANGYWILPSTDERLTLVTCWPPENNTHRLLVVASPLE
jgi:sortase A